MEIPAIRETRQTVDLSKSKETEPTENSGHFTRQKNILNYFSKKQKEPEDLCPTPKKKRKISSSSKCSREAIPKKVTSVLKEVKENDKIVPSENQDKLPRNHKQLDKLLSKVNQKMTFYKNIFFQEQIEIQSFFYSLIFNLYTITINLTFR